MCSIACASLMYHIHAPLDPRKGNRLPWETVQNWIARLPPCKPSGFLSLDLRHPRAHSSIFFRCFSRHIPISTNPNCGQQIRFLEWLSDAATPISLGRLFDGGISTDVHLPTLLACGQPIIERRSPFALEIQSHLSLPDPCDQGDYLAALRCIHSTLDCTDDTSDPAWQKMPQKYPLPAQAFLCLEGDICSTYSIEIPYRRPRDVPLAVRECDLLHKELELTASQDMEDRGDRRQFRLSHALSSSFRVYSVPAYSVQLLGTRIAFFLYDHSYGIQCAKGAKDPFDLANYSDDAKSGRLTWKAVLLTPGDAFYTPPAMVTFEYCVDENVSYNCQFLPEAFVQHMIDTHPVGNRGPFISYIVHEWIPKLMTRAEKNHHALTRVPSDLPVFGPLFRLWFDSMKTTNDLDCDAPDFELKGQAPYDAWKWSNLQRVWNLKRVRNWHYVGASFINDK